MSKSKPIPPSKSGASSRQPEDVKSIVKHMASSSLTFLGKGKVGSKSVRKMSNNERKVLILADHRRKSMLKSSDSDPGSERFEESSDTPEQLSDGMSMALGGLVDPTLQYTFRIIQQRSYAAVANVWAVSTNLDPSVCSEWSSLIALFTEYKLARAKVHIIPVPQVTAGGGASDAAPYIAAGFNLGVITTNPGNVDTVLSVPDSKMISLVAGGKPSFVFDTGNIAHLFKFQLAVGSPTNLPYAGSYGEWWAYGASVGATDTFTGFLELDIIFTGRG